MSGNRADYKGKRARQGLPSHFRTAAYKLRLTLWGCQLNVGLNSKKFTPRETNAPHGAVREIYVGFLNGFARSSLSPPALGRFCFFLSPCGAESCPGPM